ncbi:MAG: hypothetical protein KKE20_00745 [Nanoarchaeota archaeon]|nr:hypothetical protein [Nanoarchaeota archaeon]
MQAIAITNPGIEQVCEKEIKELISPKKTSIKDSVVFFEPKKLIDLCILCYKAQSVTKILLLKAHISFKKIEDIYKEVKKTDFSEFLKDATFKVKCMHIGDHNFVSQEIEEGCGDQIEGKVNLNDPDVIIYVYIYSNECYIGIDFAGFDLSKRQYRIFNYRESLKAIVGYALLRMADYKNKDLLLDPFSGSGTIPIEAALFATGFSVNYFNKDKFSFLKFACFKGIDFDDIFEKIDKKSDKKEKLKIYGYDAMLGYVKASQKNAKIAGINKMINVTRADIEWLDTKIDKNTVDKIVTHPVQITERNKKNAEKILKELFHQAEFVLKKNGTMLLASESESTKELLKKHGSDYGFKLKKELRIMQGKKEMDVLLFER